MSCGIVENEAGPGPFGAKGCGEGALAAVPAAVVNALADAGIPMYELPLTPERVWRRIQTLEEEGKWPRESSPRPEAHQPETARCHRRPRAQPAPQARA